MGSEGLNERLGKSINLAARDLPEGCQVLITVEKGSGWAKLYDAKGTDVTNLVDWGDLDLSEHIDTLVKFALTRE